MGYSPHGRRNGLELLDCASVNQVLVSARNEYGVFEVVSRWDTNASPNRLYDCNYQGIQMGWTDVYQNVPCQWIDITSVPTGNYILEMEINPLRSIIESDYNNNITQVPVFIPEPCSV